MRIHHPRVAVMSSAVIRVVIVSLCAVVSVFS